MESRPALRTQVILGHFVQKVESLSTELTSAASSQVAHCPKADLEAERKKASFNVRKLTNFLDGGEEQTKIIESICLQIERDPILNDRFERYDMDRAEARVMSTKKMIRIWEILNVFNNGRAPGDSDNGERQYVPDYGRLLLQQMDKFDRSFGMRWFVHWGLFINTLTTHGTEEQQKKYIGDAESYRIFGCFAMTELGHSSHLRGLETTATYDKKAQEFVILSPTVTATKWWIGVAGQIATHCIVFAKLIIDGQDQGVQLFMVSLRDRVTGIPFPGVSVGDIGPKMGRNGLDNGWIQFSGVRIPRENMLAKWANITPEGEFTPSPNAQLAYGSLISERVFALKGTNDSVTQALTIAVRYGVIRRQGEGDPQVMNFQGFQNVLIPHIAMSYAVHFTFKRMWRIYLDVMYDMREGNVQNLMKVLPDVHNTSASLKAFVTWWGTDALESCRRSLGGHGYSALSGIPALIADFGVLTTGGGDNIVLAQQTARYLMKVYQAASSGSETKSDLSISYIYHMKEILKNGRLTAKKVDDLFDLQVLLNALRYASIKTVGKTSDRFREEMSSGKGPSEAWNANMVDLIECSRAHSCAYMLESYIVTMEPLRASSENVSTVEVLSKLAALFALRTILSHTSTYLETGCVSVDQIELIRKAVVHLCFEIRHESVALMDAFNIPDFILNTPLGRKDGDVYENYLRAVQNTRGQGKAPYWDTLIRPLTDPARK